MAMDTNGWVCSVVGINYPRSHGFSIFFAVLAAILAIFDLSGCLGLVSQSPPPPGSGQLSINPSSVAFGDVEVNTASTQTVILSNAGTGNLTVSQAAVSGAGFTTTGQTFPLTLSAGQSSSLSVQFAPTVTGSTTGSVSLVSNASTSPSSVSLNGNGVRHHLSIIPSTVSFGNVMVGTANTQPVTLTNSGTANLNISQGSVTGAGFSMSGLSFPLSLAPGQSSTFNAQFAPTVSGSASGTVSINSNAHDSPTVASLAGSGTQAALSLSPTSMSFGNVVVGSSGSQALKMTNTGTATLTISQASVTGTAFSLSGATFPLNINPGASSSLTVAFAPTTTGSASETLTIASNAPNSPASVALSGSGVQSALTANPSSFNFGNVLVGSSGTQTITLSNSGTASVTISAASASGTGFSLTGLSVPATLNAGQNTSFTVSFAPASAASFTGSVSITSNAPGSPLTIALSGTGVTATFQLTPNPTSLSFGSVNLGSNSSLSASLSNTGNSNVTISSVTVSGAGFTASGVTPGTTLTPNQTVTLSVAFAPASAGSVTGSVSVASNATNSPTIIALSGTGATVTPVLNVSPTALSFGNQVVNTTSGAQSVSVSNAGSTAITVNNVQAAAPFAVSGFTGVTTLNAGQSLPLAVTFTPTAQTAYNGTLTITYNSTSSATVTLSGTGIVQTSGMYTSRTDRNAAPETLPTLCSPAPCTMTSSDLNPNLTYTRVTDANTDGGVQFSVPAGGWERAWNSNATAFFANGFDGAMRFYTFNPATQTAAPITCSYSDPRGTCHNGKFTSFGIGACDFSTVSPYVVYCITISGDELTKTDFSATVANGAVPPTITTVARPVNTTGIPASSCGGCQLMSDVGDTRFDVAYGGSQNTWTTVWVYDTTQHGRWFGMNTMTVGGDWGPTGNATLYNELGQALCSGSGCKNVGGIDYTCSSGHDMVMDQSGRWAYLQTECSQTLGQAGVWYFWDLATANVYFIGGSSYHVLGHNAAGWDDIWLNTDNGPSNTYLVKRVITSAASPTGLFSGVGQQTDSHLSWHNSVQGQLLPVIQSFLQNTPPTAYWQDEIVGMSTDGSQVAYRFAHMYTRANQFATSGIANVSVDGKWAIFCSDWGGTARADVYLVPLK